MKSFWHEEAGFLTLSTVCTANYLLRFAYPTLNTMFSASYILHDDKCYVLAHNATKQREKIDEEILMKKKV